LHEEDIKIDKKLSRSQETPMMVEAKRKVGRPPKINKRPPEHDSELLEQELYHEERQEKEVHRPPNQPYEDLPLSDSFDIDI
jgi:hypothetical protein